MIYLSVIKNVALVGIVTILSILITAIALVLVHYLVDTKREIGFDKGVRLTVIIFVAVVVGVILGLCLYPVLFP